MLDRKQNPKLIPYEIYFTTPPSAGLNILNVTIQSGATNIFANKRLKVLTDTGVVLTGVLKQNSLTYWLKLDAVTPVTPYSTKGIFYETFQIGVEDDNVHVTISDIKRNLYPSSDIYTSNDVLFEKGNVGLIDNIGHYKLATSKFEHSYNGNNLISILSSTPVVLGIVNIPNQNTKNIKFKHAFGITGKAFNLLAEISVNNNFNDFTNLDGTNFELKVLNYSTIERYKNIGLEITIDRKTSIANNSDYLIIRAKFNTSKITDNISTDPYVFNRIFHMVSDISKVTFTESVFPGAVTSQLKFSKGILGQTTTDTTMLINESIIGYTDNGVKLSKELQPVLIADTDNLNNYKNPGRYYKHNGNISSVLNKPVATNTRFLLEVQNFNFDNTNNELILLQRYSCYQQIGVTDNFQILTFERVSSYVSSTFTWSPWIEVSKKGHTHVPTDITETTAKRFVSQLDVDNWNGLLASGSGSNWKPTVSTPSQLFSTYPTPQIGWTAYVISTGSIHIFTGSTWVNQKSYATPVSDGILTSEDYINCILGAGIDKKLDLKNSYIHRLTEDPETIYGTNYVNINENHIDKVQRTTTLSGQLKEYVIQEGWNVTSYGSNSYLIGKDIISSNDYNVGKGTGLTFTADNQIIFGKYNTLNNNAIFAIGNGVDNANRSSIFSILNSGITLATGYSIPSGTQNDILLGNGSKINKFTLIQEVQNGIASAATEVINVPAGTENYVIPWNATRIANYGRLAEIEVWLKVADNIYNKEIVPIKLVSELNVDNQLQAVTYTVTLSNLEALILIS